MRITTERQQQWAISCLFNFGLLAGLASLAFGLTACGDKVVTGKPAPTITSVTPAGIVVSTLPQTLSIQGSNFSNDMRLSISNSPGVQYTISSSSVISSAVLSASVTIKSVPVENYVTLTLQPATGATASAVLGVASSNITIAKNIQNIFTNKCAACHTPANASGLDLSDATIGGGTGVIGVRSVGCYPGYRVVAGDPRRSSSVLIDRIKPAPATLPCYAGNPMPPAGSTPLTAQEISDIVDWVAGGAR